MSNTISIPGRKARVLVVDDHPMVRSGLVHLLSQQEDLVCCGEAGTVLEAQAAVSQFLPDVVVLDLRLKHGDGLELIKVLKSQHADLRILVLTQFEGPLYVERALRAGAQGYVVKDRAAEDVLGAIRAVLAGEIYLARGMASLLLHKFIRNSAKSSTPTVEPLTDRELHVLGLLGSGLSTREIAAELNLSFKTVETHRENIKRKLGLRGATALVHYASEWAREHISMPEEKDSESALSSCVATAVL